MKAFLTLLILVPFALLAQSYNLEDMVNYGLEHSWEMQRNKISLQSSDSSLRSSKWDLLPEVRVTAGLNQDFTDPAPPRSATTSSAGFSISKSISLNDPAYYQYKYAQLDNETARIEYDQKARDYVFSVVQAYIEVLSAQKQLSSLQENLRIQERVWEQSQVLNQLGKNTGFDVKQSEIAVMNSQISILQLENTIETARKRLFDLVLMEDQGESLEDIEMPDTYFIPSLDPESIDQLRLLSQSLKRNKLSLSQSRWDFYPNLSLSYNFNRSVGGEDFDFDTYNTDHGISLALSYSLWSPFRQKENFSRLKMNRTMAQINFDSALSSINSQYSQLQRQLSYQNRLNELYRERLDQSSQQIRIAEERYRLGLIELLELDRTRTDYIDANIQYNANQYDMLRTREEINHLLSKPILGKW